jgi:predicted DNA-binding protein YlxM (UPF0122 family)
MTKLMTRAEYAEHFGISRQAVHNRIKRGVVKIVHAPVTRETEMLVVEEKELAKV